MKSIIIGNLQENPNTTSILTLRWWLCSPFHQEHRKSQERTYSSSLSHVWSISLHLPLILGELFASFDSEDYSSLKHILLWDSRISLWGSLSPYLSDCSVSLVSFSSHWPPSVGVWLGKLTTFHGFIICPSVYLSTFLSDLYISSPESSPELQISISHWPIWHFHSDLTS